MSAVLEQLRGQWRGERRDQGYSSSFALAFAVHAILLTVLFLGVRFQSSTPEVVSVELWEPPSTPPKLAVEPPRPAPKVEPEPPKVEPKPEPKVEPRVEPKVEKPEIVEKPAPKKPETKPKPEPKVAAKKAPPKVDLEMKKRVQEELAREQTEFRERALKEQIALSAATARSKAIAAWTDKIRAKIRGNIHLPPDIPGNPEAIFDVAQIPTGEVITVKLRKSSGHKGYDDAVERAILASSPLPKPDQPNLFVRELELRFRPLDK